MPARRLVRHDRKPVKMAHSEARVALANIVVKGLSLPVEKAIRLLLALVAARILGDAVFGRYLYTSTLAAVLALGIDLGLHTWVVRALARDRVRALEHTAFDHDPAADPGPEDHAEHRARSPARTVHGFG